MESSAQIAKTALLPGSWDENRLLGELIEGLVHQFPLCCVIEYCSDIYLKQDPKPAAERGIVYFRSFSIHRAESLFNGLDNVWAEDHFVPCRKCKQRLGSSTSVPEVHP